MELRYTAGEATYSVQVERVGARLVVVVNGRRYEAALPPAARPGEVALSGDGAQVLARVAGEGPRRWVALNGEAHLPVQLTVPQAAGRGRKGAGSQANALEAQMPGMVRRVLVTTGQAVERGQALVVVEAMKMEIRVNAPRAGVVGTVAVTEGQAVERGEVLVVLGEAEGPTTDD